MTCRPLEVVVMAGLLSVIDELCAEDLDRVRDEVLEADLVEIRRALDGLEAQFLRRVAEVDRRQSFASRGVLSTTALLVGSCGLAGSTAREKVRVARRLALMPLTGAALAAGEVSYSQVRLLATAAETNAELFGEHEEALVEAAQTLTVRELRRVVDYWRQAADPAEAADRWEAMHLQRRLSVSQTFAGMGAVDGWLDPGSLAVVDAALEGVSTADARASAGDPTDGRTAAQRRADGLVEICRHWLTTNRTQVGGERPHINLLVDLATLEGRAGYRCELEESGVIPAEAARRVACDAGLSRIITRGRSEPLDVGRRTRTVPPALRRALVARDGGCAFDGCDRPPSWCDAHHIIHWVDGGRTDLFNLILLCRRHHRYVHEHGYRIIRNENTFEFLNPAAA